MLTNEKWTAFWRLVSAVGLALGAIATTMMGLNLGLPTAEEPVQRGGFSTKVHFDNNGDSLVIESGGVLNAKAGSTVTLSSNPVLTDSTYPVGSNVSGLQIVTGTTTMTGSTLLTLTHHGLTTPLFAGCFMRGIITDTTTLCTVETAVPTVTIRTFSATPTLASTVGASVDWFVLGRP